MNERTLELWFRLFGQGELSVAIILKPVQWATCEHTYIYYDLWLCKSAVDTR